MRRREARPRNCGCAPENIPWQSFSCASSGPQGRLPKRSSLWIPWSPHRPRQRRRASGIRADCGAAPGSQHLAGRRRRPGGSVTRLDCSTRSSPGHDPRQSRQRRAAPAAASHGGPSVVPQPRTGQPTPPGRPRRPTLRLLRRCARPTWPVRSPGAGSRRSPRRWCRSSPELSFPWSQADPCQKNLHKAPLGSMSAHEATGFLAQGEVRERLRQPPEEGQGQQQRQPAMAGRR